MQFQPLLQPRSPSTAQSDVHCMCRLQARHQDATHGAITVLSIINAGLFCSRVYVPPCLRLPAYLLSVACCSCLFGKVECHAAGGALAPKQSVGQRQLGHFQALHTACWSPILIHNAASCDCLLCFISLTVSHAAPMLQVHALAEQYGLASSSYKQEPQRYVELFKLPTSSIPNK